MKRITTTLLGLCAFAIFSYAQPKEIPTHDKVMLLNEQTINTPNLEYSPTFFENGIVFISTSSKSKKKAYDDRMKQQTTSIQIARRGTDGVLQKPEVFAAEITTSLNDGPVSFDRTNETIYFSTNFQNKKGKEIKAKNGQTQQKIQSAKFRDGKWQDIEILPFNNVEYSCVHPSLSVDGNALYFSSNKPGGMGGMDLYVSRKTGDTWGEPINLGKEINTEKDEVFPFIHADGTLYFASNNVNTLGGLDIYAAKMKGDMFHAPNNIGRPFNSADDDFGFILDLEKKNGYFASNRSGGKGSDDIYSFTSEEKLDATKSSDVEKVITFVVADNKNGKDVNDVAIKLYPLSDIEIGDLITDADGNIIKLTSADSTNILSSVSNAEGINIMTDNTGKGQAKLKNGDYLVNVTKDGYHTKQTILNVNDDRSDFMILFEQASEGSIPVTGVLRNNRGNPIANATITLTDENGGEPQVIKTDNKGNYKYYVKPNTNYTLSATKDNHLSTSMRINSKDYANNGAKEIAINMEMSELTTPLPTGKIFQLNNVYYNYNDATLRPDAKKDLDPLVSLLKSYPEVEIELSSHTDSRGRTEYNQQLSQRRAESVVNYLVQKGIAANRVKAMGYGESNLRNRCTDGVTCTESEHQINRRTEVKVTKGGNDLDVLVVDKLYKGPATTNTAEDKGQNSTTTNAEVSAQDLVGKGNFWVVAGSFQDQKNADEQLKKIQQKGYSAAKIVFSESIKFYRVIVLETTSIKEALSLYKKLKHQKEAAFILRG